MIYIINKPATIETIGWLFFDMSYGWGYSINLCDIVVTIKQFVESKSVKYYTFLTDFTS